MSDSDVAESSFTVDFTRPSAVETNILTIPEMLSGKKPAKTWKMLNIALTIYSNNVRQLASK